MCAPTLDLGEPDPDTLTLLQQLQQERRKQQQSKQPKPQRLSERLDTRLSCQQERTFATLNGYKTFICDYANDGTFVQLDFGT